MRQGGSKTRGEGRFVRKYAPLDGLDDEFGLPPPLVIRRVCGTRGCRATARPGGRHCPPCHAATVRRWRARHRNELLTRRRDASSTRDEALLARDSARAKVAMALRRGKLTRGACVVCGTADVEAVIADPGRWRECEWVCRKDRAVLRDRDREADERQAYEARQAVWYEERDRALAAIPLLPPEAQAKLHAFARGADARMQLTPQAPLYVMRLVHAYKALRRGASAP